MKSGTGCGEAREGKKKHRKNQLVESSAKEKLVEVEGWERNGACQAG